MIDNSDADDFRDAMQWAATFHQASPSERRAYANGTLRAEHYHLRDYGLYVKDSAKAGDK